MTDYRGMYEFQRLTRVNIGTDDREILLERFPSLKKYGNQYTFWRQAYLLSVAVEAQRRIK